MIPSSRTAVTPGGFVARGRLSHDRSWSVTSHVQRYRVMPGPRAAEWEALPLDTKAQHSISHLSQTVVMRNAPRVTAIRLVSEK